IGRVAAFISSWLASKWDQRVSGRTWLGWRSICIGTNGPFLSVEFGGEYHFVLIDRNDVVVLTVKTDLCANTAIAPGFLLNIVMQIGGVAVHPTEGFIFSDRCFFPRILQLDDDLAGIFGRAFNLEHGESVVLGRWIERAIRLLFAALRRDRGCLLLDPDHVFR